MINLVKVMSTSLVITKRVIKVLRFGKGDVQTSMQASPYGIDSNPIKDMVAVYSDSSEKGKTVIIGYLNKNQLSDVGETRMYSTDADGVLKTYVWVKNDGTIQLGGTTSNIVRFTPLDTALQLQVNLINAELVKIAAAINAIVPGSYVPLPIQLNISSAKVNEVKTL